MAAPIGSLVVRIKADVSNFSAGMKAVETKLGAASAKMAAIGTKLTKGVTVPVIALGAASVFAFANFDDAMTASLAIMGDVSDTMKNEMSDAARDVGKTTSFSATQAAEAYFFLASAGLSAEQSIAALPKVAAFAQAGNFDLAQATDLLTDSQSALGLSSDDTAEHMGNMARVSDVLVKANTLANASVEQFSEALTSKLGAALKGMNKPVEEGVAVLAALADQGVKGAEAGEALTRVIEELQVKALKNTSAFEKYGIAVYDSAGNMRNMADVVADAEKATAGMSDAQKTAMFTELGLQKRSMATMKQLLGTSGSIRDYEKDLRSAAGTTESVAAKQMESFKKQMGLVKDKLVDAGISIGSILAPKLKSLAEFVANVAERFSNLSPKTQDIIIKIGLVAAAIGPLLIVGSKMIKTVGRIAGAVKAVSNVMVGAVGWFSKLGSSLSGSTGAIAKTQTAWVGLGQAGTKAGASATTLGSKVAGMAGPIAIGAVAVGALGYAIYDAATSSAKFRNKLGEAATTASDAAVELDNLRTKTGSLTVGTREYADALAAQSAKAQEVIDTMGSMFAVYDETGQLIDANTDAIYALAAANDELDSSVGDYMRTEKDLQGTVTEGLGLMDEYTSKANEEKAIRDGLLMKMAEQKEQGKDLSTSEMLELKLSSEAYTKYALSGDAAYNKMQQAVSDFGEMLRGSEGPVAVSTEEMSSMLEMLSSTTPKVKTLGLEMFQQIIDAQADKFPEVKSGMTDAMNAVKTEIEGMPAGEAMNVNMADMIQAEIEARPDLLAEMETHGVSIEEIIATYDMTTPSVNVPGVNMDSLAVARAVAQGWLNANPLGVKINASTIVGGLGGGGGAKPMAKGGIIRKPTLVLAGEAGPELFTPLKDASDVQALGGAVYNINLYGDQVFPNVRDGRDYESFQNEQTRRAVHEARVKL